MTVYLDERGYRLTDEDLRKEYDDLRASGETEAPTYQAYVRNCTCKNGTLTRYERED